MKAYPANLRDFRRSTRAAKRWHSKRTYRASSLPGPRGLAERKFASGERISVVLPALNEGDTIGQICDTIRRRLMEDIPLVDQLLVIDAASEDATPELAREAGATVIDLSEILPEIPGERGKGEALWRSLAVVETDIVVWIDSDIHNFEPHFVTRLVAPILADPTISFVKGFYHRPIADGDRIMRDEGGRVTELMTRPLLAAFFPELGGFLQPLAGEYAGPVEVLRRVPFFTGYSVEVGLLIDLLDAVGLDGLAQIDLGERVHRNRPLNELVPMAYAIAQTILKRAEQRGRMFGPGAQPLLRPTRESVETENVAELERPPMEFIRA